MNAFVPTPGQSAPGRQITPRYDPSYRQADGPARRRLPANTNRSAVARQAARQWAQRTVRMHPAVRAASAAQSVWAWAQRAGSAYPLPAWNGPYSDANGTYYTGPGTTVTSHPNPLTPPPATKTVGHAEQFVIYTTSVAWHQYLYATLQAIWMFNRTYELTDYFPANAPLAVPKTQPVPIAEPVPAFTPLPEPVPHVTPQPQRSPVPAPRLRPRVARAPRHWPRARLRFDFPPLPAPVAQTAPATNSRPPRGVNEGKVRLRGKAYAVALLVANAGGEIVEWVDLVAAASGWKYNPYKPGTYFQQKLRHVFLEGGYDNVDWDTLHQSILDNEVEDKVLGAIGQAAGDAAAAVGNTTGFQTGPVL